MFLVCNVPLPIPAKAPTIRTWLPCSTSVLIRRDLEESAPSVSL